MRHFLYLIPALAALLSACTDDFATDEHGRGGERLVLCVNTGSVGVEVSRVGEAVLDRGTAFAEGDTIGVYVLDEAQEAYLRRGLFPEAAESTYDPYINFPCRVMADGTLEPLPGREDLHYPGDPQNGVRVYAYYPWVESNGMRELVKGMNVRVSADQTADEAGLHSDFLTGVSVRQYRASEKAMVPLVMHHRMSCLKVAVSMLPTDAAICDHLSLTINRVATSGCYNLVTGLWTDKADGTVEAVTDGIRREDVVQGDSVTCMFVMLVVPEAGAAAPQPERRSKKTAFTVGFDENTLTRLDSFAVNHNEGCVQRYMFRVREGDLDFDGRPEETDEDWTLNPYDFRYDMSMFMTLYVNGSLVYDLSRYSVAAFCGDQCRGRMEALRTNGEWYGYMRIRSNSVRGDFITLRVFDRVTERMLDCTETVDFEDGQRLGLPSNPYIIYATTHEND